jgi:hypothetical protein
MTSTHLPHTVDHHMTRVDIPTGIAFDSFCDACEQAVPAFDAAHIRHITEIAVRDARHDRALRDHQPSHKSR